LRDFNVEIFSAIVGGKESEKKLKSKVEKVKKQICGIKWVLMSSRRV